MPRKPTHDGILAQIKTLAAELPPPDTKRWVPRRKAVVVAAVLGGAISIEEVCRRYELSVEEFHAWQGAMETHGVPGLRVTRLQIYREAPPHSSGGGVTERPSGARVDIR